MTFKLVVALWLLSAFTALPLASAQGGRGRAGGGFGGGGGARTGGTAGGGTAAKGASTRNQRTREAGAAVGIGYGAHAASGGGQRKDNWSMAGTYLGLAVLGCVALYCIGGCSPRRADGTPEERWPCISKSTESKDAEDARRS
eukprot:TRINITY_DN6489_c0_g1_i1.p2 TRINITY_DN6489_c0_g1~~TRINITY_DN6489_c0_g1_i1.p2  ORF type:complete len:143 (-),score=18.10 TRINITY_DN6489_c0_g1_i1:349-777(-)